jgi:hypothetical protein
MSGHQCCGDSACRDRAPSSVPEPVSSHRTMADLSKFFVSTTVLVQNDLDFSETRVHSAPAAPVESAVPQKGGSLYDQLSGMREAAEEEFNDRYRNKPPRGLDEEDVMFIQGHEQERRSQEEQNRLQGELDKQQFAVCA